MFKRAIVLFLLYMYCINGETNETDSKNGHRIVGGTNAGRNEFPYQVSMQSSSSRKHFCGGSVLDELHILTAAHCVDGLTMPSLITVVAGEWDLGIESGSEQVFEVDEIITHKDYDSTTYLHDIAILKLANALKFGTFVAPINLPPSCSEISIGTKCTVTGWGTLLSGGNYLPSILKKVQIPVILDEECDQKYKDYDVYPSMICAEDGGKDSCQGDSGGPMYCGGQQIGIVSWGIGCADPNYPGVYTQVSHYIDWINGAINL